MVRNPNLLLRLANKLYLHFHEFLSNINNYFQVAVTLQIDWIELIMSNCWIGRTKCPQSTTKQLVIFTN